MSPKDLRLLAQMLGGDVRENRNGFNEHDQGDDVVVRRPGNDPGAYGFSDASVAREFANMLHHGGMVVECTAC